MYQIRQQDRQQSTKQSPCYLRATQTVLTRSDMLENVEELVRASKRANGLDNSWGVVHCPTVPLDVTLRHMA